MIAAAEAFPAWLNDSFRPIRRENARAPTTPRVIAASAGAKTEPAMPVRACNAKIVWKPVNHGIASDPAVTVRAPTMTSVRLAVVRSTSAPNGACATMPPIPPTAMTNPIVAWSQWRVSRR